MSPPVLLGPLDAHRAAGGNTARVWGSSRTSVGPYVVLCKRPQNARSHGHPWSRTSVLGWFRGPHGSNRWARAPGLNQRCGSFPGSRPARPFWWGGGALHRANHQRGGDCPGLILYPGGTGWLFGTLSLALRRAVPRPQPLNLRPPACTPPPFNCSGKCVGQQRELTKRSRHHKEFRCVCKGG